MLYYIDPQGVKFEIQSYSASATPGCVDVITPKGVRTIPMTDVRDSVVDDRLVEEDDAKRRVDEIRRRQEYDSANRPIEVKLMELAEGDPSTMGQEGMIIAGIGKLIKRFDELRAVGRQTFFQDVVDFHRKFEIDYGGLPRKLPDKVKAFRDSRLDEEITEYWDACTTKDAEKQLDGLVDIVYIILGTCHLHGWNFDEAWRRVHEANMRKEKASAENPGKYEHKHDIVKPKGWVPPILRDLVTIKLFHGEGKK